MTSFEAECRAPGIANLGFGMEPTFGLSSHTFKRGHITTQATALKRLAKLSEICLALPGAIREDKGNYSTFLVAKKIFAYFLNEHDPARPGEAPIVSVCCKPLEGDNVRLAETTAPSKLLKLL